MGSATLGPVTRMRGRTSTLLAPLAGIGLLILGMVGLDLLVAAGVASRSEAMVSNAIQSIELADDLRSEVAGLADPRATEARRRTRLQRIDRLTAAYDPLANLEGEREEWGHLRDTLTRLRQDLEDGDSDRLATFEQAVSASVGRLVAINRGAASRSAQEINALHRREVIIDASVGALVLCLIMLIGVARARASARERALSDAHRALIEDRNRELDQFAGRAAHDLRGPLNPIRGYADLILTGEDPPEEVKKMAALIRRSVDRMARVIDDMLELSRSGRPIPGRSSLAGVWGEVVAELGPELQSVRCTATVSDEPVAASPSVAAEVLRNLLTNALKFRSPERPLEIAATTALDGEQLVLELRDNGVGMDPESARRAFEPFFRGRSEVAGHGLGLAIVDRTLRALGGSCTIAPASPHGTLVTVRWPRVPPPADSLPER